MIPSIPAVNRNAFNSSGKDDDDIPCLLDLYPDTNGGLFSACIVLRKAFNGKAIIKARREADNVECDVFPYKIKPGLSGLHPNSLTSLGITIKEFANGGAVRCSRIYNQNSTGGSDMFSGTSSLQPRIVDTSGDFKPLGVCYGLDFSDPSSGSMNSSSGLNSILPQQRSTFIVPAKRGDQSYYGGQFSTLFFGEVGNFGGSATSVYMGSYVSASTDLDDDTSAVTMFSINGADSGIFRDGVLLKEGDPGSRTYTSGSLQYGDYFMSNGFGTLLGPIMHNNLDYKEKGVEITNYLKNLLEI